jgi:hypothetical protein
VTASASDDGMDMGSRLRTFGLALLLIASCVMAAWAEPFDLAGPTLDIDVTHAGVTLPISQTPNLAAGDQLSIKADLPPGQAVPYLLVATFLRGATNPPPESWFHPLETWSPKGADGLKITVPDGAQQVLVLLAPRTSGDFRALVNAIRGRPGVFVRASLDLNQATLDRSRLNVFLAILRKINPADSERLQKVSSLLARSLAIKVDADCFQKMPELQAGCLLQAKDALILDDGQSTSIVQALTSGPSADLLMQLSATPQAGYGANTPYLAAILDIARILDSLHTAHYQYMPALGAIDGRRLSLLLSTAPSFHNPLSVLVAALPAVEPPQPPPLRAVDGKAAYCAGKGNLVLPAEGAPLAFSTSYAHDMALRLRAKDGSVVELPVRADAEKGGFIADASSLDPTRFGDTVDGSLHGFWGFEPFDGPAFHLRTPHPEQWRLSEDDRQSLVVGRDDTVHLEGAEAACVQGVDIRWPSGATQAVDWKATQPDQIAVIVPLGDREAGPVTLLVKQQGGGEADLVPLRAFTIAGHLDGFTIHAGDLFGVLKGSRLDEVRGLTMNGITFTPGALTSVNGADELTLTASDAAAIARLPAGKTSTARATLKDGRTQKLTVSVAPARPSVVLIDKSVQLAAASAPSTIELTDKDELPLGATLTFSIRAQIPAAFSGHDKVEVATTDGAVATTLTTSDGLVLEDPQVALVTLDTARAFGASAFGPLRFRIVDDAGAGDWQPLATLVRLPAFRALKCPSERGQACELTGSNLFLVDSLSSDPKFDHAVKVPEGFAGRVLSVPYPAGGKFYVKLHDAPSVMNLAALPAD